MTQYSTRQFHSHFTQRALLPNPFVITNESFSRLFTRLTRAESLFSNVSANVPSHPIFMSCLFGPLLAYMLVHVLSHLRVRF